MSLLHSVRFEIVPLKSADAAIAALPPTSNVSVTCSPTKGIGATVELCERVLAAGHLAVPHIAARMVEGPKHVASLCTSLRNLGVTDLFLVGGDQPDPLGPYVDGLGLLQELLNHEHGLTTIGFPAYPDGHGVIPRGPLRDAMYAKTSLVGSSGLQTFVSTQMCFDSDLFIKWLRAERRAGFNAPVHLGVPGVIDKLKLMTMGARLGVGSSMRFLKKNRATIGRLLLPGGYEPSDLVNALDPVAAELDITGLHLFTFNEVAATAAWRESLLQSDVPAGVGL